MSDSFGASMSEGAAMRGVMNLVRLATVLLVATSWAFVATL